MSDGEDDGLSLGKLPRLVVRRLNLKAAMKAIFSLHIAKYHNGVEKNDFVSIALPVIPTRDSSRKSEHVMELFPKQCLH